MAGVTAGVAAGVAILGPEAHEVPVPDDGFGMQQGEGNGRRRVRGVLATAVGLGVVTLASGCASLVGPVEEETPSQAPERSYRPVAAAAAFPLPTRPNPPAPPAKPWERARSTGPATALPSRTPTPSTPAPTLTGPCLPLYGPGLSVPVNVVVTGSTATVSWYHNGDPATLAYYVGVQAQIAWGPSRAPQPTATVSPSVRVLPSPAPEVNGRVAPVVWQTITPDRLCRTVTVRVTGLTRGVNHVVYLEAESSTPEYAMTSTRHTLNRVAFAVP